MKSEYEIVRSDSVPGLVMMVRDWMARGYTPLGGFVVFEEEDMQHFAQALIGPKTTRAADAPTNLKVTFP